MMRVIGAGLGRTGTVSLKLALELLLDGPCYHMTEQIQRPRDAEFWAAAMGGDAVDWPTALSGWVATVDWPGCTAWPQLADAFPDAQVLLSTRDPQAWWASADRTILERLRAMDDDHPFRPYLMALFDHTGVRIDDRDASIAAFTAHNERVRATIEEDRLIEWTPGDGWGPLCAGLGLPVPDQPFPHANTSDGFESMLADTRGGRPPRHAEPPPYGS